MVFDLLVKSAGQGELILVHGGFCRWHLRRDGQVTIYEIFVLPEMRRLGIGRSMLSRLFVDGASSIFAKCPCDLDSNSWYERMGFVLEGHEVTRTGRELNLWRFHI
jgi:GNAT superfamily N-acetyltransferase